MRALVEKLPTELQGNKPEVVSSHGQFHDLEHFREN